MKVILSLFFGAVKSEECKDDYRLHFHHQIVQNNKPICACFEDYTSYNFQDYVSFHPFCCPPHSSAVLIGQINTYKPECTCNPGFDIANTVADQYQRDIVCADTDECAEQNACPDILTTIATISTECIPGQYRDEESQLCVPCNRGHYCIFEQQTPCPKGFFSDSPGSSTCENCGAGMTTLAEGGISPRNCITHPFGFTAFGYDDPAACEFQNFCPKGMKELNAFYGNHKGMSTCLGSEPVATTQKKISLKEHAIPAYYERTSNEFCFNLCRRKEACLAFSVSLKKTMNCVLVYAQ